MKKSVLFKESLSRFLLVKGALLSGCIFGIVAGLGFSAALILCITGDIACPPDRDLSQEYMSIALMITVVIVSIILTYIFVIPARRFMILENEIRLPSSRLPISPFVKGERVSRARLKAEEIVRVELEISSGTEFGGLPSPWKCRFFLETGHEYVLYDGEIPGDTEECLSRLQEFLRLNEIRYVVIRKGLP